tara:strand:+ start:248 stop:649 length:402 start_codon:yes stop_codon:yes gene_type:complete
MNNDFQTQITLYKNEYKAENDFKVTRIGGQRITMRYTLFDNFGVIYIKMYDEHNNQIGMISINCTTDQVVEILKTQFACTVSKADQKKLDDKIKKGRWVFFNDHSRVVMKKDHHQYDLEELIELSKKKEKVKS